MHRESMSIIVQQDKTMYRLIYFCKLLYMFCVVNLPIIRSTFNCNYSIWHWSNFGKCSVWSQLKMRVMDRSLLPSAIVEGNRGNRKGWGVKATPRPHFTPREDSGTHCTGGWVGTRAGLDSCGKSRSTGIRSSDRPARSQSPYHWATRPTTPI